MEKIITILEKSFLEISDLIQNNNTLNLGSYTDQSNNSGDDVKKVDVMSNIILKKNLEKHPEVRCIGSEEEQELYYTKNNNGQYLISYDPLDGSSNVDVNITTGTIFAVYKYDDNGTITNGHNIVMSGYCLYGGSLQYVLAKQNSVYMYQYIPSEKKFLLITDNMKIKEKGNIYAVNEANKRTWCDKRYNKLINTFIDEKYTARWVGSLVADAHRTLIKGGFFAYPGNDANKNGKIRLLYEAYPFAHIFKTAGGFSSNGDICILDLPYPSNLHQKIPIILSSKYEITHFDEYKKSDLSHY